MSAKRQNSIDTEAVQEIEKRLQASGEVRPFESKVAPEQLSSIYRSPKTREQLEKDDHAREQSSAARISKWVPVRIVLGASLLLFGLLLFVTSIEHLWFFGGMAGISASFVLAMLIIFAYYLAYGYIDKIMYRTGRSLRVFVLGYVGVFAVSLVAGVVVGYFIEFSGFPLWIIAAVLVHLALMGGISTVILRHVHDVNVK